MIDHDGTAAEHKLPRSAIGIGDGIPAARAAEFKALKQRWIPDAIDDDDREHATSPSFANLKKKTLRDLYGERGGGKDKSPKGSVDVAIRPLVDLLNVHPAFATLSSCSGRIALFDPHMKRDGNPDIIRDNELAADEAATRSTETSSGKGRGGWLLASHEEVEPSALVKLLNKPASAASADEAKQQSLVFKHEPLLLHVAASSMARGRQLLSLALQLGFRESGLVVSNNRVTVAIRTHSLALCVPLSRQGPLRPSDEYLEGLVQESNMRMRSNQDKLTKFYTAVQEKLFQLVDDSDANSQGGLPMSGAVHKLPALNLWGHATVAVPAESNDGVDMLVFGGYGEGPDLSGRGNGDVAVCKKCCRSNRVYCLRYRGSTFDNHWTVVRQDVLKEKNVFVSKLGAVVLPADFSPREGLDACLLPTEKATSVPVVALWGGRASPGKPFSDLLLYEPFSPQCSFMNPLDIRGALPEARWGHSFTALSGRDGVIALLVGGRNEHTTFSSAHVLTLVRNDESAKSHFHWTTLDLSLPPRFHHTTMITPNDCVFVFGGLSDASDLLESFSGSYRPSSENSVEPQSCVSAFQVRELDGNVTANDLQFTEEDTNQLVSLVAGSGCAVRTTDESGSTKTLVALTGGVSSNAFEMTSIRWLEIVRTDNAIQLLSRNDMKLEGDEMIDFGSMVHHSCVRLPPSNLQRTDFALIGGGVASFAFGPSFAECYHVRQSLQHAEIKRQESPIEHLFSMQGSSQAKGAPQAEDVPHEKVVAPQAKDAPQAEDVPHDKVAPQAKDAPQTKDVPQAKDSPHVRFNLPSEEPNVKDQLPRKTTIDANTKEESTNVLFVMANDAKTLKTALELNGFLDKRYRMTEATGAFQNAGKHIAAPITNECLTMLESGRQRPSWYSVVVARGTHKVPFSTAVLGTKQTK